jgi:hypothetical protein
VIVAFDTSILILLFDKDAKAPLDPKTGEPVEGCEPRLLHLVAGVGKTKGAKIIIPTPTLAEFLVKATPEGAASYISKLTRIRGVKLVPFTVRAAIEFSELQRAALDEEKKLKPADRAKREKPKFDHQIVAIAKTEGATIIYSDDAGLGRFAKKAGIRVVGIAELPLPPTDAQGELFLEPPVPVPTESSDED